MFFFTSRFGKKGLFSHAITEFTLAEAIYLTPITRDSSPSTPHYNGSELWVTIVVSKLDLFMEMLTKEIQIKNQTHKNLYLVGRYQLCNFLGLQF